MCIIDGTLKILMVPHIFRQEVYAGKGVEESPYYDGNMHVDADPADISNTSPVNFFAPDFEKYPNFEQSKILSANLRPGDCLFIPAYYFYQFFAHKQVGESRKEDMEFEAQGENAVATIVSLRYEANSHLLDMFMN